MRRGSALDFAAVVHKRSSQTRENEKIMPNHILNSRVAKYWIIVGVAAGLFTGTVSALAFGLSDTDFLYLATQGVERTSALIVKLSPKEQAKLHSLINDPRTANDSNGRNKNVKEALTVFNYNQLWEVAHPGELWDASKR